MRFYLKFLAAVAIFVCGLGVPLRQTITEVAFDLRVAYVYRCGSAADVERLLDDTQKQLAEQRGETECYEFGQRYQRLLTGRLAHARDAHLPVSEPLRQAIEADCAREAFSATPWGRKLEDARRRDELATAAAALAHEFGLQLD
jgi:hypothetical protein